MTQFSLSAIIVTYNSAEVIGHCLDSLYSNADLSLEIVLVDNCSSDNTLKLVRDNYPHVRVVENLQNLGFAAAVNQGGMLVSGEYIALINPDAVVTTESLHMLLSMQHERNVPSVIAPRIVQPHGRLRIVSAGHFPSSWRMWCHYVGLSRLVNNAAFEGHYLLDHQLEAIHSVDWVTGAVWVVPASEWRALHGLTERWFMYAEDVEFCWRAKARGLEVLVARDVTATHLVGGSSGEIRSIRADWIINLYDFYCSSMNASRVGRVSWKAAVFFGLLSRSLVYGAHALRTRKTPEEAGWLHESRRFWIFARELMKVKV